MGRGIIEQSKKSRLGDRMLCLLGFIIVCGGGYFIHVRVLPLPVESVAGGIFRYSYFLLWLYTITCLLGRAMVGLRSRHWGIYPALAIVLGYMGGFYFAGHFGMFVGLLSGLILVGPLCGFVAIRSLRHRSGDGRNQ
jgi:hypothetical protein